MFTNYVICSPPTDKSADAIVSAYLKEVYCTLGGSRKSYMTMEVSSKLTFFQRYLLN